MYLTLKKPKKRPGYLEKGDKGIYEMLKIIAKKANLIIKSK